MKKILIITYYWPPSGGPGVQRWLKFSKYLPEFGYDPIIITVDPEKAEYPIKTTRWNKMYEPDKSCIERIVPVYMNIIKN